MAKLIVVTGATGQLGGSVARRMLEKGWQVRAVTRNIQSDAAKALAARGADLTTADYDNEASLSKAFEGASAIFAVTNFWEHIQTLGDHGAGQKEYDQILRIASAAGKTASLDHFVLHSLPSGEKLAGKDYLVPHWDYKDKAADEIQRSLPELAKKTTFLWVGWFASNFHNPLMRPVEIPGGYGAHTWMQPCKPSTIIWISEIENNVGTFVAAILTKPDVSLPAKYCMVATDIVKYVDALKLWGEVTGKRVQYVQCTPEEWEGIWGLYGKEIYQQLSLNEVAEDWGKAHAGRVIGAKELGIQSDLLDLRQALERDRDSL